MVPIVFGIKSKHTVRGYAVDFCGVCRAVRVVRVRELSTYGHVYMVAVGGEIAVGHTAECLTCGFEFPIDIHDYRDLLESPDVDPAAMEGVAFPALRERRTAQLQLAELIRSGGKAIGSEERRAIIELGFRDLATFATMRRRRGIVLGARQILVGCAVAAAAIVGFIVLANFADKAKAAGNQQLEHLFAGVAVGVMLVAMAVGFAPIVMFPRKLMKGTVLPLLARWLAPLDPTEDELEPVLKSCRSRDRTRAWYLISVSSLQAEIQRQRAGGSAGSSALS